MQEKSLNQTQECREPPMDRLARLLWEQCDFVAGVGVGITIVTLIWLVFHVSMSHATLM